MQDASTISNYLEHYYDPKRFDYTNLNFAQGGSLTNPTRVNSMYEIPPMGYNETGNNATVGAAMAQGWGDLSLMGKAQFAGSTLQSLLGAYNSFNTARMAKEQMAFQKKAYEDNFNAQRKVTNSQLEDRQTRRVAEANSSAATRGTAGTVSEYMDKYGV